MSSKLRSNRGKFSYMNEQKIAQILIMLINDWKTHKSKTRDSHNTKIFNTAVEELSYLIKNDGRLHCKVTSLQVYR